MLRLTLPRANSNWKSRSLAAALRTFIITGSLVSSLPATAVLWEPRTWSTGAELLALMFLVAGKRGYVSGVLSLMGCWLFGYIALSESALKESQIVL